jgi:translation initiation factor eIF-2B subunit epsilon
MASKQGTRKPAVDTNSLKQEEKLQAVVILDSYTNNFEPFSSSRPECLLPLIGDRTLLDSTVEFLIQNEVKELVLFCTRHHQQIKAYVDKKDWPRHFTEIHFLYNFKCQSLGDALREIDAKGVIHFNFILVTATSLVTNASLRAHLDLHKETCKGDRNAVMTMLCTSRVAQLADQSSVSLFPNTMFIHNASNRILHYEQIAHASTASTKYVSIPTQLLENAYNSSKLTSAATQQAVDAANAKFKLHNQQAHAAAGHS